MPLLESEFYWPSLLLPQQQGLDTGQFESNQRKMINAINKTPDSPASAADNSIARFDGGAGAVQSSAATISDSGVAYLPGACLGLGASGAQSLGIPLVAGSVILGLTAGSSQEIARFGDTRGGAALDGLRVTMSRITTAATDGDWNTARFNLFRHVDSQKMAGISFGVWPELYIRGNTLPDTDSVYSFGSATLRWAQLYAATGTVNTSDATLKSVRGELSEAELRVARRIGKMVVAYQWRDAVAAKGDAARIHVGPTAQDVAAVFVAEGLDPSRYAIWCQDSIKTAVTRTIQVERPRMETATEERERIEIVDGRPVLKRETVEVSRPATRLQIVVDEMGQPVVGQDGQPVRHAVPVTETVQETITEYVDQGETRMGLRPDQLALFLAAAHEQALVEMEARLAALEQAE